MLLAYIEQQGKSVVDIVDELDEMLQVHCWEKIVKFWSWALLAPRRANEEDCLSALHWLVRLERDCWVSCRLLLL